MSNRGEGQRSSQSLDPRGGRPSAGKVEFPELLELCQAGKARVGHAGAGEVELLQAAVRDKAGHTGIETRVLASPSARRPLSLPR